MRSRRIRKIDCSVFFPVDGGSRRAIEREGLLRVPMRRSFDSTFGSAQDDSCLFAGLTKVCEGRSNGSTPLLYGSLLR